MAVNKRTCNESMGTESYCWDTHFFRLLVDWCGDTAMSEYLGF